MLPEVGVILDAGTAMFRVAKLLQTRQLDIYLSHTHLDHVVGLTYLLDLLQTAPLDRVTIHVETAKIDPLRTHLFSETLFPVTLQCDFVPLGSGPLPNGGTLTTFPLDHPGGSVGMRLDWPGHSLAYVTDTTARADADYVRHLQSVDVLVHECNFPDGEEPFATLTGHSCLTPVLEVAKKALVKRLILTHLNPLDDPTTRLDLAAAAGIFPATEIAHDLQIVAF
jgi:ribonuclease BN (tRNA processing enzyme)